MRGLAYDYMYLLDCLGPTISKNIFLGIFSSFYARVRTKILKKMSDFGPNFDEISNRHFHFGGSPKIEKVKKIIFCWKCFVLVRNGFRNFFGAFRHRFGVEKRFLLTFDFFCKRN